MSMSKEKMVIKSSSNEQTGYGYSFVIGEGDRSYIEGRLLTFLESLGLKDSQEKAAKDLLRQEVSSWFYSNALGISSELSTAVHNIVHRLRKYEQDRTPANHPVAHGNGYGFDFEITATERN